MTAIDLAVKTCSKCGETKPVSEFYRHKASRDGLDSACKPCKRAGIDDWQRRERERMGDDAWKAYQSEVVARSRRKPEVRERGREARRAYGAAERKLRERHPDEFAELLRLERYERGLS